MSDPTSRDPGPMARFEEMIAEEGCMNVIVQRMTDADSPETLEDIARSRKVPYGRLSAWITESRERSMQYANALDVMSRRLALQAVSIADNVGETKGEQGKAKLRIDTRFKLASHLAPDTFGNASQVNVNVKDDRTPADRDAMLLETARGVAFMLYRANRIKERMAAQPLLEAPAEAQPKDVTPAKGPI